MVCKLAYGLRDYNVLSITNANHSLNGKHTPFLFRGATTGGGRRAKYCGAREIANSGEFLLKLSIWRDRVYEALSIWHDSETCTRPSMLTENLCTRHGCIQPQWECVRKTQFSYHLAAHNRRAGFRNPCEGAHKRAIRLARGRRHRPQVLRSWLIL